MNVKTFSFLVAVALLDVCLGAEPPQGKEPTYHGKTVSEWIARTKDKDERVRRAAAKALGEISPAAIPALVELLKDKSKDSQEAAIEALRKIGPVAIPALMELLKDKTAGVQVAAASALGKIGVAAIPALTELLKENKGIPAFGCMELRA